MSESARDIPIATGPAGAKNLVQDLCPELAPGPLKMNLGVFEFYLGFDTLGVFEFHLGFRRSCGIEALAVKQHQKQEGAT